MDKKVLDSQKIVETISVLHDRICERFANSGISSVCKTLEEIAKSAADKEAWISKPIFWLRGLVLAGCSIFMASALAVTYLVFKPLIEKGVVNNILSNVEKEVNFMILIGGATLFLWTLENRYKRWRALQALHELRSVAHVIDMHQLTKDPDRILSVDKNTSSSPEFKMTGYELRRYLDYCAEMLALTGKIAALYVQKFDDSVALAAASEVETLTTGLSRKIWQKLMILHSMKEE